MQFLLTEFFVLAIFAFLWFYVLPDYIPSKLMAFLNAVLPFFGGAYVLEQYLKTRADVWVVMLALVLWTWTWAYWSSAPWLSSEQSSPVCELIVQPNVYNLYHHEGYKRYYILNKQKLDRLWGRDEPLTKGGDPAEDKAYHEQRNLGLWNQRIRFVIKDRLVWADFFQKTFLDELSFGSQMFGNPFPERDSEEEPYLEMVTKNGVLRFSFNYPRKHYDGTDDCLIAEFPLRLFSELPQTLMNFHGKSAKKSRLNTRSYADIMITN